MNALGPLLQEWKGRAFLMQRLEERGFRIPREYERAIHEFCADDAGELEVYWNEWAREYVSSAGKVFTRGRDAIASGEYRSKYLDQLEEMKSKLDPRFSRLLHPGLVRFSRQKLEDKNFALAITANMERRKSEEIAHLKTDGAEWDGSKQAMRRIFKDALRRVGFEVDGSQMLKRTPNGLWLIFAVDVRGRSSALQIPSSFVLATDFELSEFFPGILAHIIEGFGYYTVFSTPPSAVLGVQACAEALCAFADSFAAD